MDNDLFYFLHDIAVQTPVLEKVQNQLEQSGHPDSAMALRKLIRDSGTALSREFGGDDGSHGPVSAGLDIEFEPVTWQRIQMLNTLAVHFPDNTALNDLAAKIPGSPGKKPMSSMPGF